MRLRPSAELIQSLRVTLQKIEENFASPEDEPLIAELRRILLLRIAELESADTDKSKSIDEPAEGVTSAPVPWLRPRS